MKTLNLILIIITMIVGLISTLLLIVNKDNQTKKPILMGGITSSISLIILNLIVYIL